MNSEISWNIIHKYFENNKQILVKHHLDSYNEFYKSNIIQIFNEKNPIILQKEQNPLTQEFKNRCEIYIGGLDGSKIYFGKPIIYDDDREHFMYPNDARLRNMTYGMSIHYDIEVLFKIRGENDELKETTRKYEKIFLGNFPIMIQSDFCILKSLDRNVRYNMGECKNDYGGYFIIDGKEKVIVSQEKFADNMLYIRDNYNDVYSHGADMKTVSEDASKPARTLSVRILAPSPTYTNNQIVVSIPNVRKPIPLFILMRALGVLSDKEIISYCLLDLEKNKNMVDLFIPSIHDASYIFTQKEALEYIKSFLKTKTISNVHNILINFFLPHIGELNYQKKAFTIGNIVYKLLLVFLKIEKPTDRDSFKYKRIDVPGKMIYDLFNEYYTLQQTNLRLMIDKQYTYKKSIYENNFIDIIELNQQDFFKERILEDGFKKAFKGNWGATEHTKKLGALQGLNRLSYNAYISHLRKLNLPMDASAKIVKPRLLHGSQWGIIDPLDTPDGGNVGLHKHLAISAYITSTCSKEPLKKWLRSNGKIRLLEECDFKLIYSSTKIFVNGEWVGINSDPEELIYTFKKYRRNGLINPFISINWNIESNEIYFYTDSGRLCRPLIYYENNKLNIERKEILEKITSSNYNWEQLITGFAKKKIESYDYEKCDMYSLDQLYGVEKIENLNETQGVLEYLDTSETESTLINIDYDKKEKSNKYTHLEIHPSLLLGVMGNQIVFPENNQLPRDLFFCGQAKQAVSLYHSNFFSRIDKMGVVLNYGQKPLVKSRYLQYINNEEHPYGENVIAAIMVYGGYNVEDAILVNEGAVNRGLFRTSYYNMYEARETSSKVGKNNMDSYFSNVESESNTIVGKKPGYNFSDLDEYGLIKENTLMDDTKVVIGKLTTNIENPDVLIDSSIYPKKGQLGYVDKAFITEDEEGFRLAKIRIREDRVPAIGDKFCSRCGQKGTIGLIIPEHDMPFTEDGIRPDIIINPHALPSRMTIGQLVETLMGKACVNVGAFGDCTAFVNKGSKHKAFGNVLTKNGFNSTGNQLLYNGMTGQQLESEIFIGPTYYMRLKHMVKDKINYRSKGPRTMLTRQVVQGRANDGGLRIGEMERDCLISHGATTFLKESMLVRGDDYYIAICNNTGTIAIYNENKNIFLSPMVDGPIKFTNITQYDANIEVISKYGRSFSIIRVPYAFKLLYQELQAMNIQMRIITEENIDQFTSMNYSDNIKKLTHNEEFTIEETIANILMKTRQQISDNPKAIINASEKEEKPVPVMKPENNYSPEMLGWIFDTFDEDKGEIYKSLLLDKDNKPTEIWYSYENDRKMPQRFPNGWKNEDLYYDNQLPIEPMTIINELNENQVNNNWNICLENIKSFNINNNFVNIVIPEGIDESDNANIEPRNQFIEEYKKIYPDIIDNQGAWAYAAYFNNKIIVPPERLNQYSPPFAYDNSSPAYNPNSPVYNPNSPAYNPYTPPGSPDYPPPGSPDYPPPGSPDYPPPGSSQYNPNSPPYAPGSPDYPPPGSPQYNPNSPPYAPGSPQYNPNSPYTSPSSQSNKQSEGIRIDSTSSNGSIPPPPPLNNSPDSNIIELKDVVIISKDELGKPSMEIKDKKEESEEPTSILINKNLENEKDDEKKEEEDTKKRVSINL
jgi:DNA-directed RNA polymerase II subunit RPB2